MISRALTVACCGFPDVRNAWWWSDVGMAQDFHFKYSGRSELAETHVSQCVNVRQSQDQPFAVLCEWFGSRTPWSTGRT
jgi:hypothetical protein